MGESDPRYKALLAPEPCSLGEARACLDANEVGLIYVLGEEASYLIVMERATRPGDRAWRFTASRPPM